MKVQLTKQSTCFTLAIAKWTLGITHLSLNTRPHILGKKNIGTATRATGHCSVSREAAAAQAWVGPGAGRLSALATAASTQVCTSHNWTLATSQALARDRRPGYQGSYFFSILLKVWQYAGAGRISRQLPGQKADITSTLHIWGYSIVSLLSPLATQLSPHPLLWPGILKT